MPQRLSEATKRQVLPRRLLADTIWIGRIAEVVVHERSGLIAPSRSPADLQNAILTIRSADPKGRAAMGQLGRTFVAANYEIRRAVDRWEQGYARPAALLAPPGRY